MGLLLPVVERDAVLQVPWPFEQPHGERPRDHHTEDHLHEVLVERPRDVEVLHAEELPGELVPHRAGTLVAT